jgi:hypothetical protein
MKMRTARINLRFKKPYIRKQGNYTDGRRRYCIDIKQGKDVVYSIVLPKPEDLILLLDNRVELVKQGVLEFPCQGKNNKKCSQKVALSSLNEPLGEPSEEEIEASLQEVQGK